MQISTIGLDIAKNVFQVHGIDAAEKVVVRKRLRRRQVLEFFKALPLRRAQENPGKYPWLTQLLARRPFKVVAVALANKMARMAWALLAHGGTYRAPELAETA